MPADATATARRAGFNPKLVTVETVCGACKQNYVAGYATTGETAREKATCSPRMGSPSGFQDQSQLSASSPVAGPVIRPIDYFGGAGGDPASDTVPTAGGLSALRCLDFVP